MNEISVTKLFVKFEIFIRNEKPFQFCIIKRYDVAFPSNN